MWVRFPPAAPEYRGGTCEKHGRFLFFITGRPDNLIPNDIYKQSKSRRFDITFDNGSSYSFSYEFLRVFSPSAEVQGHTPNEAKLQIGKQNVMIEGADAVGSYALRFRFSDGHDSGIYSWEYFDELGKNQNLLWDEYLRKIAASGFSRDPEDPATAAEIAREEQAKKAHQCHGHA